MFDVQDAKINNDHLMEEVKYNPVTDRLSKIEDLRERQGGLHFFSEPQTIDKSLKADVTP